MAFYALIVGDLSCGLMGEKGGFEVQELNRRPWIRGLRVRVWGFGLHGLFDYYTHNLCC
jgi:hypothetical protein